MGILIIMPPDGRQRRRENLVERLFCRALDLDGFGQPEERVMFYYEKALRLCPEHLMSLVNLGTIYFGRRQFVVALEYYDRAIQTNPYYGLAHFNYASTLDELGRREEALTSYQQAIYLGHTDAYYNLALLYQGTKRWMEAVACWQAYIKADPLSMWAVVARRELQLIRGKILVKPVLSETAEVQFGGCNEIRFGKK